MNYCMSRGEKIHMRHTACDAILIKDNKVLLALRSKNIPDGGKWCLPGGRLDRDETATQGVIREVKEETGYDIENIQIFRISTDPNRRHEIDQNVVFVFTADVLKQTSEPDQESSELKWFDIDNLPDEEDTAFDHLQAIQLYLKNRSTKADLPIMSL